MKQFCSFPEIGQYRNIVKTITDRAHWAGKDENGDPIFDRSRKAGKKLFHGTVKLHGCFEKNTLITLANGERIPISEVKKGMSILSYDLENNKEVIKEVTNEFKFESNKKWIELVFSDRTVKCTEDHKFYTKNRGWVEAKDLTENDEFILE
jgi:hypothetical protein